MTPFVRDQGQLPPMEAEDSLMMEQAPLAIFIGIFRAPLSGPLIVSLYILI